MKVKWALSLIALAIFAFLAGSQAYAAESESPLDRASALFDKHDYKGAIALLDRIIAADPKNAKALIMRGDAKDENGDPNGALEDYNAGIEINPDFEYAYATRCGTQLELSHNTIAVTDCTKALALNPKDDMALRERSAAYYFLGDDELAEADAQAAMAVNSSEPGNILASCRAAVGVNRDDLKDCDRYVTYQPNDENGYFYRGRMQMIDQEPVKAQNDFHKALQIDPTFTAVHYWLAEIALELQSYNEAISEADAFLAQNTNDADTLLLRANAEQRLGQVDKARADGTLALKQYRIANDSSGEARAQSFLSSLGH